MSEVLAPAHQLDVLAQKINASCDGAEQHARQAVALAIEAGKLLATAKKQVPHGEWEQWLAAHCTVAVRTAQAYMRLASKFEALSIEEAQRVALLPLREAMAAISTPAEPPKRFKLGFAAGNNAASAMQPTLNSFKALTRDIQAGKPIRADRLAAVRKKLLGVVETLNLLEAHASPVEATGLR